MLVVVTGSSSGIGYATAIKFLQAGHDVVGIDVGPAEIFSYRYTHICEDIRSITESEDAYNFISNADIIINNAGVQESGEDIDINLKGTMRVTEIALQAKKVKSIVMIASVSAHNGAEFPEYVASKGGMLAYTKNVAQRIAKWGGLCNSISFGGVITELNRPVMDDKVKWNLIMEQTPLNKWATAEECAEWIYFVAAVNKSMTGQDIIIDNGETNNAQFIW